MIKLIKEIRVRIEGLRGGACRELTSCSLVLKGDSLLCLVQDRPSGGVGKGAGSSELRSAIFDSAPMMHRRDYFLMDQLIIFVLE
jgi:hypothetical protein